MAPSQKTTERDEMADETQDAPASPARYTIPEAAAYLGVSEPTIYRWMKDGILSFYKIGNATRFSRESLDAVIEKQTGRKEAEAAQGRCAACGHSVLVGGRMQGTGRLYFRPDRTRFWTFQESLVPVVARVCAACGYIQLNADTEKLSRLRPGRRREDEPAE